MPFLVAIVAMRRGLGMISKIEVSQLNGLLIPEYCLLLIRVISLIGDGVSEINVIPFKSQKIAWDEKSFIPYPLLT